MRNSSVFNGVADGSGAPRGFTPKELAQPANEPEKAKGLSAKAWLIIMLLVLAVVIGLGCLLTTVTTQNNWQKGQRQWIATHQL